MIVLCLLFRFSVFCFKVPRLRKFFFLIVTIILVLLLQHFSFVTKIQIFNFMHLNRTIFVPAFLIYHPNITTVHSLLPKTNQISHLLYSSIHNILPLNFPFILPRNHSTLRNFPRFNRLLRLSCTLPEYRCSIHSRPLIFYRVLKTSN